MGVPLYQAISRQSGMSFQAHNLVNRNAIHVLTTPPFLNYSNENPFWFRGMQFFLVISALILFVAAGASIIRAIDRSGAMGLTGAPLAGVSFMTGLGAVSFQMFLYSLVSIPLNPIFIMLPWLPFIAAVFFRYRTKTADHQKQRWDAISVALLAVIIVQSAYAFIYALSVPLFGWDAWFIWFLKARVFFLDQGISSEFLSNAGYRHHQDYPLLMPLATAFVYGAAGSANETIGKLLYPLQFLSLLSVIYYALSRAAGRRAGLLFAALSTLVPVIMIHAGGVPGKIGPLYAGDFVGYSDLALSIYFMGAGAFLYFHAKEGGRPHLLLASLFLAMAAWTKNEGLTFAGFAVALFLIYRILFKREGILKDALLLVLPIAAVVIPWSLYKAGLGIGSEYVENLSLATIATNLWKLPIIFKTLGKMVFSHIELYNFCWWAYAISTLANWRASKALITLHLLLFLQLSAYIFIYIISPAPIDWHLATSADRLLLHLLPLALLITALNLVSMAGAGPRVSPGKADA